MRCGTTRAIVASRHATWHGAFTMWCWQITHSSTYGPLWETTTSVSWGSAAQPWSPGPRPETRFQQVCRLDQLGWSNLIGGTSKLCTEPTLAHRLGMSFGTDWLGSSTATGQDFAPRGRYPSCEHLSNSGVRVQRVCELIPSGWSKAVSVCVEHSPLGPPCVTSCPSHVARCRCFHDTTSGLPVV